MIENTSTLYKMIILYMLKKVTFPLSNSQITNFLLDHEYTTYFHIQQTIHDLMDTHLILERKQGNSICYEITPEGQKTLSYFEKDISQDIRNEVKEYLESCGCRVQERILTPADYYTTPQGGYAVRCQIIERDSTIMDLSMAAPGKEAAQAICRSWASKSQDIYEMLMSELIS